MAASSGSNEFVVLSSGSIPFGAANPDLLATKDGTILVYNISSSKETVRRKVTANGCFHVNGTLKAPLLAADEQRTPQVLLQCCHPCPYHQALNNQSNQQECLSVAGNAAPPPLPSGSPDLHTEYSATACQKHMPLYQTACCLQSLPSFCLHHQWPEHFQHQPVQQHVANIHRQEVLLGQPPKLSGEGMADGLPRSSDLAQGRSLLPPGARPARPPRGQHSLQAGEEVGVVRRLRTLGNAPPSPGGP